jgi:hypothetical protein
MNGKMNKVAMLRVAQNLMEVVNMDYATHTFNFNDLVHSGNYDGNTIYVLSVKYLTLCGLGDLVHELVPMYNQELDFIGGVA